MVGLQGSGKSTKAKELATEYNAIVLSSDGYRKMKSFEGASNEAIFTALYKDAGSYLRSGVDIIIDATNTTLKSRRKAIEALKSTGCEFVAYIMNTPYEVCVERVMRRNEDPTQHNVPLEVLTKYLISFEIPFYEEGFSDIIIDTVEPFSPNVRSLILLLMKEFDQKTPHHDFKLLDHCMRVASFLPESARETGILHDVGKMFTQSFDDKGIAHYYGHHNAGAYYLVSNTSVTAERDELLDLLFIVNYHMYPFQWQSEKSHTKWKGIFGETKYNALLAFNEADKKGSKV